MNVKDLYRKIIPSDDYETRRDFDNEELIDNLDTNQRLLVEDMLIKGLEAKYDLLIIETLAYIKSTKSIPLIEEKLNTLKDSYEKVIIAWCLFSLNRDKDRMVKLAIDSFSQVSNDYSKTYLFYYLVKFDNEKINKLVESYCNSSNILLSHNSTTALKEQKESRE